MSGLQLWYVTHNPHQTLFPFLSFLYNAARILSIEEFNKCICIQYCKPNIEITCKCSFLLTYDFTFYMVEIIYDLCVQVYFIIHFKRIFFLLLFYIACCCRNINKNSILYCMVVLYVVCGAAPAHLHYIMTGTSFDWSIYLRLHVYTGIYIFMVL